MSSFCISNVYHTRDWKYHWSPGSLVTKDEFPAVDTEGKEALNFQITVTIALSVSWILSLVLIGFVLIAIVGLANIVFIVLAAIETAMEGHTVILSN